MRGVKTGLLLIALTMLLVLGGGALGGRGGATLGLVIAAFTNMIAYFFSDKIALASSHAQPVTREQAPKLYAVMERLCAKGNLPMPKLCVIPEQAPNAFATGRNPNHASVAVTAGLLELMNEDELEGVIAHELSHVRNYDILITSIAATVAGAVTWLAHMAQWGMIFGGYGGGGRDRDDRGGALGMLLMIFLAPLAALLLQLGLSRQREYAADAAGVRLVGQPYGLISALKKLGAYNQRIPMNVPPATSSLFIVKPLSAGPVMSGLFSTHPPLADRIAELEHMTITRS
jgi:heat shock protein HtpX